MSYLMGALKPLFSVSLQRKYETCITHFEVTIDLYKAGEYSYVGIHTRETNSIPPSLFKYRTLYTSNSTS